MAALPEWSAFPAFEKNGREGLRSSRFARSILPPQYETLAKTMISVASINETKPAEQTIPPHPFRYSRLAATPAFKAAKNNQFADNKRARGLRNSTAYLEAVCTPIIEASSVSVIDVSALIPNLPDVRAIRKFKLGSLPIDRPVFLHFGKNKSLSLEMSGHVFLFEGAYVYKNADADFEIDLVFDDTEYLTCSEQSLLQQISVVSASWPVLVDGRETVKNALAEIKATASDPVNGSSAFARALSTAICSLLYLFGPDVPDIEMNTPGGEAQSVSLQDPAPVRSNREDETVLWAGRNTTVLGPLKNPGSRIHLGRSRSMALPLIARGKGGLQLTGTVGVDGLAEIAATAVNHGLVPPKAVNEALAYAFSQITPDSGTAHSLQ